MRTEGSIEIDRPIDEVFELTNNHVAEWSQTVDQEEIIEKTPDGVGTTFRSVCNHNGKPMEFDGVVTKYSPPNNSAIEMTGPGFDIQAEYTFEDLSGRTRVTQISHVTGKGFFKIFFALFGWMMNKSSCDALEKELNGLKTFCESRS